MNEYDSDKILDILNTEQNYVLTNEQSHADLIIFNTCSIREKAQEKVFSDLGRVRHLKDENKKLLIAVGGCVASQEGHMIIKRAPYVDVVFGPQTIHNLPKMLIKARQHKKSQIDISFPEIEKFDKLPTPTRSKVTAFVSIMEGCSKYCSYCIVPYTRGEEISRPVKSVLQEIKALVRNGTKEVNLLGQNVNAYLDTSTSSKINFSQLLHLVHAIPEIERIRFTTSHPKEMTDDIINCFAELPKLSSHFHLPVQSGSNEILKKMKRGYTVEHYKMVLNKIRSLRPNISFSSDFIIGFPGETKKDFLQTMELVNEIEYDNSFSFIFSPRPGTPAAFIQDLTTKEKKLERLQILQQKLQETTKKISNDMVGSIQQVLIEGISKKDTTELKGRTDNFKVINFKAPTSMVGKMVEVRVTSASMNTLRGELIS